MTTPQTAAGMSVATITESQVELPGSHFKPIDSYIPKYSSMIQTLLQTGEINKEWDMFVEETAYHVLAFGDIFPPEGNMKPLDVSWFPNIQALLIKQ